MRSMKTTFSSSVVLVLLLMASASAPGSYTYYQDEEEFVTDVPFDLTMESFELLSPAALGDPEVITDGFTLRAVGGSLSVTTEGSAQGGYATDGDYFIRYDLDTPPPETSELVLELDAYAKAFGLNVTGWGDLAGTGLLTFSLDGVPLFVVGLSLVASPDPRFAGVISSTPFDEVTFTQYLIADEAYSVDEVRYGIPEPGTLALLGIAGTALIRRKGRRGRNSLPDANEKKGNL